MKSLGRFLSLLKDCLKLLGLLLLVMVGVPMLPVIGLLAWALLSPGSPPACSQDASATAPDGRYVASAMSCVSTEYIGGASTWNEVRVCASSIKGRCQTVYAANKLPAIVWTNERSLTIAVDGDSYLRVFSSLRSVFDVAVLYNIIDEISEEDFRKKIKDYGQRLVAQNSPEFVREWSQNYLNEFHAFQLWARANAGQPGQ